MTLLLLPLSALAAPLVQLPQAAPGLPEAPCATPRLLPALLPLPDPLPPAPPGATKESREAIDGVVEERTSENFAVKWGSRGGVSEATAQALLQAYEDAWAVQVEAMEHPGAFGSDRYRVNVYVEDTGLVWDNGSSRFELSGSGASGYFFSDPEGYPMLVMSQGSLADPDYAAMVSAHEHYHAVQAATEAYAYSGVSAWYWEATASWAAGEVRPDVPEYAVFLFGFALLPWLSVDFFDYPDTGALQEYHQYGAFIFPRYLSEHEADWTVVRDSWLSPDPGGDPLAAVDASLQALGSSVEEALVWMAAHDAAWDYADGEYYRANVETYAEYYSEGEPVLDSFSGRGSDGWLEPPSDQALQRLGHALIEVECTGEEGVVVELEGDAEGTSGSPARWRAVQVTETDDGPEYAELQWTDGAARWESDCAQRRHHVAISVGSDARATGETFPLRYRVTYADESGSTGGDDTGPDGDGGGSGLVEEEPAACGCSGSPAVGGLLLALLPLWARRRR